MAPEINVLVLLVTLITIFLLDKLPMDLVAIGVVVLLAVSGIITPKEAVSGFSNSVVVMIAALFVVGEGLYRTGVAAAAGDWIIRAGGASEVRLLMLIVPTIALLSAFMSSTGAVALFVPVVMSICRKSQISPSRLMMPLAYGALIGGMMTLIGTPPNIVVSGKMVDAGLDGFSFFDFTPVGLVVLGVGMVYLCFVSRYLLPKGSVDSQKSEGLSLVDFASRYALEDHLYKLKLNPGSKLSGKTVYEVGLRTHYEVTVFGIAHFGRWVPSLAPVLSETRIDEGDTLLAYGSESAIEKLCKSLDLSYEELSEKEVEQLHEEFGLAEVLVLPESSLVGKTIKDASFRKHYNLNVIGILREGKPLIHGFKDTELHFGDTLLLSGSWRFIRGLSEQGDFVVLRTPKEIKQRPYKRNKAPIALLVMLSMLLLMVSGVMPNLSAILLAALAMIVTGCVTLRESYKSMNVPSLVLLAGMLPLAIAMDKSGALQLLVDKLLIILGDSSPIMLCAALFVFTSLFSQFMSNTATTVLIAPVALAASTSMGVQPEPVMMSVAIAASTAFATPIASPVNTLVLAPGGYRFKDFLKVGIPLQLIVMVVSLGVIPLIFPF